MSGGLAFLLNFKAIWSLAIPIISSRSLCWYESGEEEGGVWGVQLQGGQCQGRAGQYSAVESIISLRINPTFSQPPHSNVDQSNQNIRNMFHRNVSKAKAQSLLSSCRPTLTYIYVGQTISRSLKCFHIQLLRPSQYNVLLYTLYL